MLLLDSTMAISEPVMPPGGGYLPYFPSLIPALTRLAGPIGLLRLATPSEEMSPFEPRTRIESAKEMEYESMLESLEVRDLGEMPLIVLTAGRHRITPPDNPIDAQRERSFEALWQGSQQKFALLSTRGEQRFFPEAGHNLLRERPREVVEAIRDIVTRVRRGS